MKFRIVIYLFGLSAMLLTDVRAEPPSPRHGFSALVFSKTAGFRHASIEPGIQALRDLAIQHDFELTATEDASVFSDSSLAQFDVVIFLNTTGDILNPSEQGALERFIQAGKGFVGLHAAADTEYGWPWYGGLVGAYFDSHPAIQSASIRILDRTHPATASLPDPWVRTDEWYNFRTNPRPDVHVLATLDESTYGGGNMGFDHPWAWCQVYDGGRSFYTAGGHTSESYSESKFLEMITSGIEWAAGVIAADCGATQSLNFRKTILDDGTRNPMDLAVANDRTVFYLERSGTVHRIDPSNGASSTVATLDVVTTNEDGLIGIALDPEFDLNGWMYLFYSPATGGPRQRISRFTYSEGALDPASESILLEIPVQRDECCHSAGSMDFDRNGNLYIAVGDNTNPFESDGYAPIDERPGRSAWDAQKSSSNPADLRGKILRIHPLATGGYEIPSGNLFPAGTPDTAPEIYAMGARNPFRMSVDPVTGWVYWGEVGPDAHGASAARGPAGLDEWNQARAAGNFGWPYCIGDNAPYMDFDFDTGQANGPFDCQNPVNTSPNNTGASQLPTAMPAWIYYPYDESFVFPAIPSGPGRTAMAGPVYHVPSGLFTDNALPEYYEGALFIYEWTRNWIGIVKMDDAGDVVAILPFAGTIPVKRPIAMEAGPDGALYIIEWGTGFGGNNDDSQVIRIDYRPGSRSPVVVADVAPRSGQAPLTVVFDASASSDPDPGDRLDFAWDFESDGIVDATSRVVSHTYTAEGNITAVLTVSDQAGNDVRRTFAISVGNTIPQVRVISPPEGGFFEWGDTIPVSVSVTDAEDGSTSDGSISCDRVKIQLLVGHDGHAHPLSSVSGCTADLVTSSGHGSDGDDTFHVIEATYTDSGHGSVSGITSTGQVVLHPRHAEAEHFDLHSGIQVEPTQDPLGGRDHVAFIDDGDYIVFRNRNLRGISSMIFRVASAGGGGSIDVRLDAVDGRMVAHTNVPVTGDWNAYTEVVAPVDSVSGGHDLYLVFSNPVLKAGLFNLNWIEYVGPGVAVPETVLHGVTATYFTSEDLTGHSIERMDPQISFYWSSSPPFPTFSLNTFSIRWSGWITPSSTGNIALTADVRGGARVIAADRVVLDEWAATGHAVYRSSLIRATGGQKIPIVVEFRSGSRDSGIVLSWDGIGTPIEIVPPNAFSPSTNTAIHVVDGETPGRNSNTVSIYPNPSTDHVYIEWVQDRPGDANVSVYDPLGRRVVAVRRENLTPGRQVIRLSLEALSRGIYYLRVVQGGITSVHSIAH